MMATTGPFTFLPGDSQFVMLRMSVDQGTSNLSSISVLKNTLNGPYAIPTDVPNNNLTNLPDDFSLSQNYPNPFNPSTEINFSLPVKSDVTLEVFNILGQHVKTLVDERLPAGKHQATWNGTDDQNKEVSTGIYLYKLTAGDIVKSKKMVLLK